MERREDLPRLMALVGVLGVALLGWAGAQYGGLPQKVTVLETKEVIHASQLEKIDAKLDRILERLARR
jgi:hypothetical protein